MSVKRNSSESIRWVHLCNQRMYMFDSQTIARPTYRRFVEYQSRRILRFAQARRQSICVVRVTTVHVQQLIWQFLISGNMKQFSPEKKPNAEWQCIEIQWVISILTFEFFKFFWNNRRAINRRDTSTHRTSSSFCSNSANESNVDTNSIRKVC